MGALLYANAEGNAGAPFLTQMWTEGRSCISCILGYGSFHAKGTLSLISLFEAAVSDALNHGQNPDGFQ